MVSSEEIKNLYINQLQQKLKGLEKTRKDIFNRYIFAFLLILVPILINILFKNSTELYIFKYLRLIILGVPIGFVLIVLTSKKEKAYRLLFKNNVVSHIVHTIDPKWSYEKNSYISQMQYQSSDLFSKPCDRYKGDDLISGVIENTDFRCSELHTEYKSTSINSKGEISSEWCTIFKGLFFHFDFNKEFSGNTYVKPDLMENLFGKFGQNIQRYTGNADLVKLENPEFEKHFVVHATDQTEARYILTPTIMEAILQLRKEFNRNMEISFSGSRVYFAFSFSEDLFEPRVFKSGVNFNDVENIYNLFLMNAKIIKELNLNTRIWTKK